MEKERGQLFESLDQNIELFQKHFGESQDFKVRQVLVGGRRAVFALCDGLINSQQMTMQIVDPILRSGVQAQKPAEQYKLIRDTVVNSVEQDEATTFKDAEYYMMSGYVLFLLDGHATALVMGAQGWTKRGTDEPSNEVMATGAKECFVETMNDNIALLRKRMKTTDLRIDPRTLGRTDAPALAVCYIKGKADTAIVDEVKKRLESIPADVVIDYGSIQPYLDTDRLSLFSAVGNTERPDTLCGKMMEGRIGVMVDGTPFVLVVPFLFSDNFQSLDEYDSRPYYATFVRWLKYFSFFISIYLPGGYVAIGTFHQELFPSQLLYSLAVSEMQTPFSLMVEAIIIHIIYEVMREAGLRLPKSIGHAVSIIGAVIIGDAVVSAGLIGTPMLIVVAMTAISSFVVYPLYEPVSMLRFAFIYIGGFTGLYGIVIVSAAILVNMASMMPYGVPYTAPFAPFDKGAMQDVPM
ncbi:MAG: spore germination protein, partial [Clostridiales bacterium]|nr:spore germination protein [Clostridiales bacterium]